MRDTLKMDGLALLPLGHGPAFTEKVACDVDQMELRTALAKCVASDPRALVVCLNGEGPPACVGGTAGRSAPRTAPAAEQRPARAGIGAGVHRHDRAARRAIGAEPLSQAALDTLAIIAYEQPITRADIRGLRSEDSDAVVEPLRARGLVAEDPALRPRPAWLSHHHAWVLAVLRVELAQQSGTP